MGLDGFGWIWMGLDEFGWVWMCLDGSGWVWMCLDGSAWWEVLLENWNQHTRLERVEIIFLSWVGRIKPGEKSCGLLQAWAAVLRWICGIVGCSGLERTLKILQFHPSWDGHDPNDPVRGSWTSVVGLASAATKKPIQSCCGGAQEGERKRN